MTTAILRELLAANLERRRLDEVSGENAGGQSWASSLQSFSWRENASVRSAPDSPDLGTRHAILWPGTAGSSHP
jgi:hypothetical protein